MSRSITNARIKAHNERAARLGSNGDITVEEWLALCERFDNRCVACGIQKPLTVDHIIPLSMGGANTIDNIQPLCRSCNSSKHTKSTDYRQSPAPAFAPLRIRTFRAMTASEIKALRTRAKLSQEEFAAEIGVSVPTVSRWEHGQRPLRVAQRALQQFEVELLAQAEQPAVEATSVRS